MAVAKSLPEGVTEDDIRTLRKLVAQNFQDGQNTVASHRKIVAALKNYQDRAVSVGLEEDFNRAFVKMVNRVLRSRRVRKLRIGSVSYVKALSRIFSRRKMRKRRIECKTRRLKKTPLRRVLSSILLIICYGD